MEEMKHHQPKTSVTTDNIAAQSLITKIMIPKRTESYDMRFNFLKCRESKKIDFIWRRGKDNREDYHSKCHQIKHYIEKGVSM